MSSRCDSIALWVENLIDLDTAVDDARVDLDRVLDELRIRVRARDAAVRHLVDLVARAAETWPV